MNEGVVILVREFLGNLKVGNVRPRMAERPAHI